MPRAPRIYLPFDSWPPRIKRAGKLRSKQAIVLMGVAPVRTLPKQPGGTCGSVMPGSDQPDIGARFAIPLFTSAVI